MIKAISKTLPPAAPPPPKPTTPETEARSSPSSTSSPKYKEFTCDYCTLKVGSDDPRPKYTFKESDMGFCSEACREAWKKNDRWWKDWEAKQKKEAQEWENYKCQQDQKWNEYFRNLNNSNYRSYSTYTSPTSSGSGFFHLQLAKRMARKTG